MEVCYLLLACRKAVAFLSFGERTNIYIYITHGQQQLPHAAVRTIAKLKSEPLFLQEKKTKDFRFIIKAAKKKNQDSEGLV